MATELDEEGNPIDDGSTADIDGPLNQAYQAYGNAAKAGDTEATSALHDHIAKLVQAKQDRVNKYQLDSDPRTVLAGAGRGMANVAAHVGLPDITNPDVDKPLLGSGNGQLGNMVGEGVATAPIGMAGGALAGAAGKALQGAKVMGPGAWQGLTRYFGRAALAGGEGAASSAATGDDAGTGAGINAAGSVLTGALGKYTKGIVGKNEETQHLYDLANQQDKDIFVPISQGGAGPAKEVYNHALTYVPGVEAQLKNQSKGARKVVDDIAADQGMMMQEGKNGASMVPAPIGKTSQQTAADMRQVYDQAYQNTVKSHAFNAPKDFRQNVIDNIDTDMPGHMKSTIGNHLDSVLSDWKDADGTITGANLLNAKRDARATVGSLTNASGNQFVDPATKEKAMSAFDDIIQNEIDEHTNMLGGKLSKTDRASAEETKRDLENYQRLGPAYAEGNAFAKTAEGNVANRGAIRYPQLARNAPDGTRMQDLAQTAHAVLDPSAGGVNPAGRHLLHSAAGIAGGAAAIGSGHIVPLAAGLAAGNIAATKTFQKGLYGDLGLQQRISSIMRNNPGITHQLGYEARQAENENAQR